MRWQRLHSRAPQNLGIRRPHDVAEQAVRVLEAAGRRKRCSATVSHSEASDVARPAWLERPTEDNPLSFLGRVPVGAVAVPCSTQLSGLQVADLAWQVTPGPDPSTGSLGDALLAVSCHSLAAASVPTHRSPRAIGLGSRARLLSCATTNISCDTPLSAAALFCRRQARRTGVGCSTAGVSPQPLADAVTDVDDK